ncbi:hypothetical protein [Halorubrum kocurii]|uniref:Uncharacterized protein n=1 Tax=Halorubrum kocurii JCM 14978 TaxID=1230456 RepID=M0P4L3_9EURY|nr:hypothetical protein [Halorubrum kocurii]EMA63775.1 hypothetical protein C468_09224 [Halorubrum kocurii JCM 14978]
MSLPTGLAPFADQSRTDHAAVLAAGALVCLIGYVGVAALLYGLGALDHAAPDGPRRVASAGASAACWGVYAAAFARGKGGPVTNAFLSPTATVAVVPAAFRWAAFGPAWGALRDRIGLFLFRPGLFVDAAALTLPGLAFAAGLLAIWASRLDEAAVEAWQREHLSTEFRRAFVEE